jgi:serine/threonine-protein kinase
VYGVERISDGKRLAIKLVNPTDRQTAVEIAILSRLSAECPTLLVRYHGQVLTLDPEHPENLVAGVVMDWLAGPTLRQRMDKRPKLAWLLTTLELLAEQLACVHAAGIVHRDIKPENIVFDASSAAKLIDYGIGCSAGQELSGIPLCTAQLTGTLAYLAPELLRRRTGGGLAKSSPATPASDIWALGATMYEWLLGETLKQDMVSSFASHTEERIRAAQEDPRVPPLIRSMLSIDPAQRPSAQQIVELLNQ